MKTEYTFYVLIRKDTYGNWYQYAESYDKEILSITMDKLIRKGYHRTDVAVVRKDMLKEYLYTKDEKG